jgi:hypothetical protein
MLQTVATFVKSTNFFPCCIMTMYVGASIRYFLGKDLGRGIYWIAACLITFSVTFMIKHQGK